MPGTADTSLPRLRSRLAGAGSAARQAAVGTALDAVGTLVGHLEAWGVPSSQVIRHIVLSAGSLAQAHVAATEPSPAGVARAAAGWQSCLMLRLTEGQLSQGLLRTGTCASKHARLQPSSQALPALRSGCSSWS